MAPIKSGPQTAISPIRNASAPMPNPPAITVSREPTSDESSTVVVRSSSENPAKLWIKANAALASDLTPWVPALLPIAMRTGRPVQFEGEVEGELLDNARRAATVLNEWFPALRALQSVTVASRATMGERASGVGCFFSGGVDSFHSVLANRDRITHLIFVEGFDIPLDRTELLEKARSALRSAAADLDLPLVIVRTNVKQFADKNSLLWGRHYHGAALGAVAQALAPTLGTVIVPASYQTADLHPWGSHPDLDPLWSGSRVLIEHHGTDASRPAKVASFADHQVALDHLRVCYLNPDEAYNCGECEKCLRTSVNLKVSGLLERCRTLPDVSNKQIARMHLDSGAAPFVRENLAELQRQGRRDDELANALNRALRWSPVYDARARAKELAKLALRR